MITRRRGTARFVSATASCGLATLALVACLQFWAERKPELALDTLGSWARLVGPSPARLHEVAAQRMRAGVAALSDTQDEPARRLAEFARHMSRAEVLLEGSLRADPSQARVWTDLAAVRFELRPETPLDAQLSIIAHAGSLAPNAPSVQLKLGRLLLGMGQREMAEDHLRRAAELNRDRAAEVVELLHNHLYNLVEIVEIVPDRARVLALLEANYRAEERLDEYIDEIEQVLHEAPPELVRAYGDACLGRGDARRLLDGLATLGTAPHSEAVEIERTLQRSRALHRLGQIDAAIHEAEQLRRLRPASARILEHYGHIATAAGRVDDALEAQRGALRLLAAESAEPRTLARVYRQIGQSEERRGLPDRAYDAYRRALELDPEEAESRRRLEAMERAARPGAQTP